MAVAITVPILSYILLLGKLQGKMELIETDVERMKNVCDRVTALETKITPFWNWIDKELPMLIKGKNGRTDTLLTKYSSKKDLTEDEHWELVDLLIDRYKETDDAAIKLACSLLIERLKHL